MRSGEGSCVMYGVETVLHHHRSDRWIFCDGEADTRAMEMRFRVGARDLKVPRKVTRRIANPAKACFSVEKPSAAEVNIDVSGGNHRGITRLYLQYKQGVLVRAQAHAVDAEAPEILVP